ncbi:zf-RING_2 domain-containing protein [Cephalotus follicularis]|uniref:Zf-RING_2 domain-containing protein n=1 Tax=Cephalotus follicularis TaxID=3775 RepID=A0A1Q3B4Q6_CEPFO|nr:zf-RING_2 domain-containing protein [Cephalotus follicularis]
MGISNFPTAPEGVLPVLVMNTVLSVALLKNVVRSVLQVMGATSTDSEEDHRDGYSKEYIIRERRVSITQFKSFCHNKRSSIVAASISGGATVECCMCLCEFDAEEEVSELSCNHFFHKSCLEKWFNNKHSTCPLCRSIH